MVTGRDTIKATVRKPQRPAGGRFDARALVAFFALAYALSWAWVILLALTHQVVHGPARSP
jgi:hypothetical protein